MTRKSARKPEGLSAARKTEEPAKGGQPFFPRAGGVLQRIYNRMPQFSFFDRSAMWMLAITLLVYFAFTAVVFLATPSPSSYLSEQPLHKNAQLSILPGESYSYAVSAPGESASVSYRISASPSCAGALVSESPTGATLCLQQNGFIAGDFIQQNYGYGNRSVLLFAPWMLAASEDFSWQANVTYSAGGAKLSIPIYFRPAGNASALGRPAYKIAVSSEIGSPSTLYIDSEKRVLLYNEDGNFTILLVSAPFALNASDLPQK